MEPRAVVVLFGALLAAVTVLGATERFVAPDGNDGNPGTRDVPFASLARAREALRQGRRFRAVIGIEDTMLKDNAGSATFAVEVLRGGTWQRIFESPLLRLGPPQPVDADITGAEQLRLITTDGSDNIHSDHTLPEALPRLAWTAPARLSWTARVTSSPGSRSFSDAGCRRTPFSSRLIATSGASFTTALR